VFIVDDDPLVRSMIAALVAAAGLVAEPFAAAQDRSISEIADIRERRARLTEREREVLAYLIQGAPNKTIAYELGIAQRTIELHRSNVMNKMGARSIAQLVRMMMNLERAEESPAK